jgi:WD40 repeat protein
MATGQMAEKNAKNPRKKILSIYVWDIEEKKVLKKLDGFHTIAVVLLEFSPSGKLLFSVGNDNKNSFAIYDWKSGSILYSGPVSNGKVNGISWKS